VATLVAQRGETGWMMASRPSMLTPTSRLW